MRIVKAGHKGRWWDAVYTAPNRPKSFDPLLLGEKQVVLSDQEAVILEAWAKKVPGWNPVEPPIRFEPARPI